MSKIVLIKDSIKDEPYALVSYDSMEVKTFALTEDAEEWSEWANQSCKTIDDIRDSLTYSLQTELPRPATEVELDGIKQFTTSERFIQIKSEIVESKLEMVGAFSRQSRRFAVKTLKDSELPESPSSLPLTSFNAKSRQAIIEYKALTFRADNKFSATAFEAKGARALWDPNLGPSGGWRCPTGSQFGGFITDRFGRGCGGGILRRVGRALADAGRGIDKLGEARGARRLGRAADKLNNKPREGRAQRAVGNAANALERGAQGLVGDYKPGDAVSRRRGVSAPDITPERKKEIDDRLMAVRAELDDLVDQPPTPDIQKRITELTDENKKLRRERDGAMPKRVSAVTPAPSKRRVVKPEAGREGRVQGARPVKKPVTQGRRQGVLDRASQRLVGEYDPSEYKPGDKKRIKDRENRYAKVSDEALANALKMNSPKAVKPGQNRDIEANKRQERLEVLQEMLNRGLDIPEQFKKEVKQYRLKPQRKKRGAKAGSRRSRAANALERAAQRVLAGDKNKKRRDRSRRKRAADALERGAQRILGGNKKPKRGYEPKPEKRLTGMGGMRKPGEGQITPEELQDLIDSNLGITGLSELRKQFKDYDDAQIDDFLSRFVKAREKMDNDDPERLKLDKWIINLEMEKTARELDRLKKGKKERDNQRARARRAVTAQSAFTPIRRPRPKKMKGDKIAWDDMDAQQKARMRNRAIAELDDLDASWRKRLGLKSNEPLTDKMIRDYIKERENNKPGAYIGVLKANANDWGVLKDYANDLENGDILNNLGPKRRKTLVDDLNNASAPKRVKTPSSPRPKSTPSAEKRDGLNTAEKKRLKELDGPEFDNQVEAFDEAERLAKSNNESMVAFEQDGKFRVVKAQDFNDLLDGIDDDSRMQNAIGSVRHFDANGNESKIDVSESSRVKQSIKESLGIDAPESLGGSVPDERSRRNVRNRFPNNGLPEKAFWRDKDWKARTGGDDADKHERRFGRYFDSDGNINARGRFVNQQLEQERADAAKPRFSKTPASVIPQSKRRETSTYSFGKLQVFGEDNNGRVLWRDKDGFVIPDNIVNDEAVRQRYMRYAKEGRDAYLNGTFAQNLGKKIDDLLINNDPDKRRDLRTNLQNLIDDRRFLIARDNPVAERGKWAGELVAFQNMLNELDSHPNALDISPMKNEGLDSLPKASVKRRDLSLIKLPEFKNEKEVFVQYYDLRNDRFKAHLENDRLDDANIMIEGLANEIDAWNRMLADPALSQNDRVKILARRAAAVEKIDKFNQDLQLRMDEINKRIGAENAKRLGIPRFSEGNATLSGSAKARLAILGNNYQIRLADGVGFDDAKKRAEQLAKERNDDEGIYIAKDKKSGKLFLLSRGDFEEAVKNDAFSENYIIDDVVYATKTPAPPKPPSVARIPDLNDPFDGFKSRFSPMDFDADDKDNAIKAAKKYAVEFDSDFVVVQRISDGKQFVLDHRDYIDFVNSPKVNSDDFFGVAIYGGYGKGTDGMPRLNAGKKQLIDEMQSRDLGRVFPKGNRIFGSGDKKAKERAQKFAKEQADADGRNRYVIDTGKNYMVVNEKEYQELLAEFNNNEQRLNATLSPEKFIRERKGNNGVGRDALLGPREMPIDADEYKDAVVAVHDGNGAIDQIPDPLFAAVVFDENLESSPGNALLNNDGSEATFEDIFSGRMQPGYGAEFENKRFKFKNFKDAGDSYGGIWSVYRVEDKETGEIWYVKSSTYGANDAMLEDIGMEAAGIFNFAAKNDAKQIRISAPIAVQQNGRQVRWTAMRDIDQWDAPNSEALTWEDAGDAGGIDGANVSLEDMAGVLVLDYVLDNQDRHQGNFKVATDSNGVQRLGVIDNGLMFGGRAYDMLPLSHDDEVTPMGLNEIASKREALDLEGYRNGTGNILMDSLPSSFVNRLRQSQFARDEFNLQVKYAIETMRENIDKILDEQRLDGKGIKLNPTEIAHLKAMKLVADARLKYLEANPDAFLEVFGVTGSVPSPINAPMSPIRRPKRISLETPIGL
jgi:hypothetical protein